MQRLEPVIVQEKGLAYSPKGAVTTKWEFSKFDFGSAMKPKSFESDMILVQPHHNYEPYLKEFYDTYKILAPTVLERTGLIPSDLVPEVLPDTLYDRLGGAAPPSERGSTADLWHPPTDSAQ